MRWNHKGLNFPPELVSVHAHKNTDSNFLMLSRDNLNTYDADVCIDPRGIITLFLSKETYEQLGIVGKPLPFKEHLKHERGTNDRFHLCYELLMIN